MKKNTSIQLPPDVVEADLKYPSWEDAPKDVPYEQRTLTFYRVGGEKARKDRGWIIATLFISKGKNGQPDRTYGIGVDDEKIYTVGNGPHVTDRVVVHVSTKNQTRLGKYIELYVKGMADAGTIRDRISTRRAQGQVYRSQGRTSWNW